MTGRSTVADMTGTRPVEERDALDLAKLDAWMTANVAGYALTVKDDGTAELQVPLGGQVTLRWAGQ